MKYAQIAKKLGWAEVPDTEEGLFLQPEELTTIDNTLTENATAIADATTAAEAQTARISELEGQLTTAQDAATVSADALTAANGTIQSQTARITELEAMGAPGTTTTTDADSFDDKNKKTANDFDFQKELLSQI